MKKVAIFLIFSFLIASKITLKVSDLEINDFIKLVSKATGKNILVPYMVGKLALSHKRELKRIVY